MIGLLKTVASELAKYDLDLVAVQRVRWIEVSHQPTHDCTFFYGNGNANRHLGTGFFVHKGIISAFKRVEFISERILYMYTVLILRWYDIIVLNVQAPNED